jgi:hypothetical protein
LGQYCGPWATAGDARTNTNKPLEKILFMGLPSERAMVTLFRFLLPVGVPDSHGSSIDILRKLSALEAGIGNK